MEYVAAAIKITLEINTCLVFFKSKKYLMAKIKIINLIKPKTLPKPFSALELKNKLIIRDSQKIIKIIKNSFFKMILCSFCNKIITTATINCLKCGCCARTCMEDNPENIINFKYK